MQSDMLYAWAREIELAAADAVNEAIGRLNLDKQEEAAVAIMIAAIISGRAIYATSYGDQKSDAARQLFEKTQHYGMQDAAQIERRQKERRHG